MLCNQVNIWDNREISSVAKSTFNKLCCKKMKDERWKQRDKTTRNLNTETTHQSTEKSIEDQNAALWGSKIDGIKAEDSLEYCQWNLLNYFLTYEITQQNTVKFINMVYLPFVF